MPNIQQNPSAEKTQKQRKLHSNIDPDFPVTRTHKKKQLVSYESYKITAEQQFDTELNETCAEFHTL